MTVISKNLVIPTSAPEPRDLNAPQFGYQTYLRSMATIIATSEQPDFEATNVANDLTYNFWKPQSLPATISFTLPEARQADYLGIAANDLKQKQCSVVFEYFDGSAWVQIAEFQPDGAAMVFFDAVNAAQWRLTVSGAEIPSIGVIYLGVSMQSERKIYGGYSPINLNQETEVLPNISEGGQWLGRSIIRSGAENSIEIDNLTADWVRETFAPFVKNCRLYPFFFAWKAEKFQTEVAYCWTTRDIQQTNQGIRDLMRVDIPVRAIVT